MESDRSSGGLPKVHTDWRSLCCIGAYICLFTFDDQSGLVQRYGFTVVLAGCGYPKVEAPLAAIGLTWQSIHFFGVSIVDKALFGRIDLAWQLMVSSHHLHGLLDWQNGVISCAILFRSIPKQLAGAQVLSLHPLARHREI